MKQASQVFFYIIILLDNVNSWSSYRRNGYYNNLNGCSFKKCKKDEFCVIKKFWCKNEPCPYMLYCAKSQQESLKGPTSCDSVTCSKGHICSLKVRQCTWGKPCQEQYARCITDYEFYEGPSSCAGYKCSSSGNTCILRESFCPRPPCRLLKSCSPKRDVHGWLDHCNSLNCLSEHECFMRKPDENCRPPLCKHKPDCIIKNENELNANEKCSGWICPKNQQCVTQVVGPCQNDNCKIIRSCVGDIASDNKAITKDWSIESSSQAQRHGGNLPKNNHQNFDLDDKQALILFLEKLNEERNSYLNIINQTQKLISESQSVPVNIPQLDLVLENHTDKVITASTVKNLYHDLLPHLRIIPANEREIIHQNDEEKSDKIVEFSDNDEVTFNQDYNHNLTYPKIYIKVENNMNPPIKLGNVRMRYRNADDSDNYDDNNDDNNGDDYHDINNHHVEEKNIPSTLEIQRKNNSPLVITTKENSSVFSNNNIEIKPWKKLRIKGKIGSLLNIKPDYFKRFPNLEVFDIHTGKISLKPNFFQAVNKTIKKLYLTINDNSDSLKNAFTKLDLLNYLEIYNSNLEYIKHDTFSNITNGLVDLKLSLCNISFIEKKSFKNLINLHTLILNENNLHKLEEETFHGLDNMKILSMRHNKLTIIANNIFEKLKSLIELDVSYNNINNIENNVFLQTKITKLSLHNNNLTNISGDIFGGIYETLSLLELESNQIFHIKENTFFKMHKLRWVNLSHNKLKIIENKSFNGIVTKILDISNNELIEIQDNSFNNTSIKKLYLPDDYFDNIFNNVSSRINWNISTSTNIISKKKELFN